MRTGFGSMFQFRIEHCMHLLRRAGEWCSLKALMHESLELEIEARGANCATWSAWTWKRASV